MLREPRSICDSIELKIERGTIAHHDARMTARRSPSTRPVACNEPVGSVFPDPRLEIGLDAEIAGRQRDFAGGAEFDHHIRFFTVGVARLFLLQHLSCSLRRPTRQSDSVASAADMRVYTDEYCDGSFAIPRQRVEKRAFAYRSNVRDTLAVIAA